jgi:hypothetical protein
MSEAQTSDTLTPRSLTQSRTIYLKDFLIVYRDVPRKPCSLERGQVD